MPDSALCQEEVMQDDLMVSAGRWSSHSQSCDLCACGRLTGMWLYQEK